MILSSLVQLNGFAPKSNEHIMENQVELSAFMRAPVEIRLMIYDLLLDDCGNKTFTIESESPELYKSRPKHRRTSYRVLGPGIQRRACDTTYILRTPTRLHTNILAVNRTTYSEGSWLLYSQRLFEFNSSTESIVPFFSDLTPQTRELIHSVSVTKQPAVYSRDFDRCEWSNVCSFFAHSMCLRKLTLRVIGGQPLRDWEPTSYTADEFKTLAKVGHDSMDWVRELQAVRGLTELEIVPDIRLCPPPNSKAMEFFAAFSASIHTGFAEYMKSEMLSLQQPAWEGNLFLQD